MKTSRIATLLLTLTAAGTLYTAAANPFVDVPAESWAYQSVIELADSGIIQGIDGTHFEGNRTITRYEAAEIVAKAMAHMDTASVEQRALIHALADEFSSELQSLGIRISALESKVGQVRLTGDTRLRYQYQQGAVDNDDSWDYRIRLRATAPINENTTVTYGISSAPHNFGSNGSASSGEEYDIYTDVANIDYRFAKDWSFNIGRTDMYLLGGPRSYGYQHGDAFDRAELQYANDRIAVTAGYGKFKEGDLAGSDAMKIGGAKTGYGEIEGFFGSTSAGIYYNTFFGQSRQSADDLWGAYVSANIGSKWNILVNTEQISDDSHNDPQVWIGQATYGKVSIAAPHSWAVWVEYIDAEDGAFLGGSTNSWRFGKMDNIQSWGAGVDYTLAQNILFGLRSSFATKTKSGGEKDPEEQVRAHVYFFF